MLVYCVWEIFEQEYCGKRLYAIFQSEEDAQACVAENQDTFEHYSGYTVNVFSYTEEEVM